MRHLILAVVSAAALAAPGAAGPGSGGTVGYCVSDILYGNQPNMADGSIGGPQDQAPGSQAGNVLPSQSPGPFVNNPADPDNPIRGRSVGGFRQDGINITDLCRAYAGAN